MIGDNGSQRDLISAFGEPFSPPFGPSRLNGHHPPGATAPLETRVAASALGEGGRIVKASAGFLDLLGYPMSDLLDGSIGWRHLAPSQFPDAGLCLLGHSASSLVDVAPFKRELSRKDGTRIRVEIAAVILESAPFRWFVTVRPAPPPEGQDKSNQPLQPGTLEFEGVVGNCAPMKRLMELVEQVAPTDATALILGETGTGKELVARAIHKKSPRRDGPFITLNCAAVPAGILESELFGHERGAFTSAHGQRSGRFELANGGTLFLDEIGDLPVELQPKILRALQEKTIERLGGTKSISVNVRIIAATNRDLPAMIADKLFRSELYYRLNVFPITTPALRERGADISLLVNHFTRVYSAKMGKTIDQIPVETMRALVSWPWPGNVRELENFIERSVILSTGNVLQAPLSDVHDKAVSTSQTETLDGLKRQHVLSVLKDCNGVVAQAARRLGMCRTTLNALMSRLQIHRKEFSGDVRN